MKEIVTKRLALRAFRESDYDDLYEFLYQLRDDEFEGYPDIKYENGREHLKWRMLLQSFFYNLRQKQEWLDFIVPEKESRLLS